MKVLILSLVLGFALHSQAVASPQGDQSDWPSLRLASVADADEARVLKWEELIPSAERGISKEGAAVEHFSVGKQVALESVGVVAELEGQWVRLPGFIVPLDWEQDQLHDFLLVPYFGACIHVPPPPPNQIVYAKPQQAFAMASIWKPFWIEGRMRVSTYHSDVGNAAYTLEVRKIEPYE